MHSSSSKLSSLAGARLGSLALLLLLRR